MLHWLALSFTHTLVLLAGHVRAFIVESSTVYGYEFAGAVLKVLRLRMGKRCTRPHLAFR